MKKAFVLMIAMMVFLAVCKDVFANSWTTLDYPGADHTIARDIDGSNIVGYYAYNDNTGRGHGFLYDGTNWTSIDYPGALETSVWGVEGSNIVGYYYDSSSNNHGFLYDGTNWTTLDYPGAKYTKVYGIDGSNIVGRYLDSSNNIHGFLYDGTNWTTLDYPGAIRSKPKAIDGSNIVGHYYDGDEHGFLYDGTNWTTLDYPGATQTEVHGIDGSKIVGAYYDASDPHSSFYDGTNWTTIDYPGSIYGRAYGIDGNNIVGYYYDGSAWRGFLYVAPIPPEIVSIDIIPKACPNECPIKGGGSVVVAILGTADFDVTSIDPTSVRLEGVAPVRSSLKDKSGPVVVPPPTECECTTEGRDGFIDLCLKFDKKALISALVEVNVDQEYVLTLSGVLNDGTPIEGKDCIVFVKKGKKH